MPDGRAPRIGVTTYARDDRSWFAVPGEYVDAVRRAGGVAVVLAPGEERRDVLFDLLDGVVLTGGGDVDPARYGGRHGPAVYHVDGERDAFEAALLERVLAGSLPALCICRGMQLLNVVLGGTLIEHLPDEVGESVAHRLPPREAVPHPVEVEAGSRLARLLGATHLAPHSWHHQAVRALAPGLRAVARSTDGVIEAVELEGRPDVLAVQWHPELSAAYDPAQQGLFEELARSAARRTPLPSAP